MTEHSAHSIGGLPENFDLGALIDKGAQAGNPEWPEAVAAAERIFQNAEAQSSEIVHLRTENDKQTYAATHDQLTGLPNRAYLMKQLEERIHTAPGNIGLIFSDNDGLKAVNDASGHAAGDSIIRKTGNITQSSLRRGRGDTVSRFVARLGGDEFVSLVPGVDSQEQLDIITRRVQAALVKEGIHVSMGGRIHRAGETAEAFLEAVDRLMYEQKQARKNTPAV